MVALKRVQDKIKSLRKGTIFAISAAVPPRAGRDIKQGIFSKRKEFGLKGGGGERETSIFTRALL